MKRFRVLSFVLLLAMVVSCFTTPLANNGQAESSASSVFELDKKTGNSEVPSTSVITDPFAELSVIIELKDDPILDYKEAKALGVQTFLESEKATKATDRLLATQERVKAKILQNAEEEVVFNHSYTNTINGFSATLLLKDVAAIMNMPEVKKVYVDKLYSAPEVTMNESTKIVGASHAWANKGMPLKGEGMVIAVIDGGCDPNHEVMKISNGVEVGMTEESYAEIFKNLRAYKMMEEKNTDEKKEITASDFYGNKKFPFVFDYADIDTDILSTNYSIGSHGTHVAGTVAGNRSAAIEQGVDDYNARLFNGIAPEAQIVGMKVFPDESLSASVSTIIAAIDDAVALKVNAINLSLGSPLGFSYYSVEGVILDEMSYDKSIDNAKEAGISVVVAAGNWGKIVGESTSYWWYKTPAKRITTIPSTYLDYGTMSSPGAHPATTAVANLKSNFEFPQGMFFPGNGWDGRVYPTGYDKDIYYNEWKAVHYNYSETGGIIDLLAPVKGKIGGYEYPYTFFRNEDHNKLYTIEKDSLKGEIICIELKGYSREQKNNFELYVDAVVTSGAIACVFYPDRDKFAWGNGAIDESTMRLYYSEFYEKIKGLKIPFICVNGSYGQRIEETANPKHPFSSDAMTIKIFNDSPRPFTIEMAQDSGWGTTPDLKIKPEITAPGSNIYSAGNGNKYYENNGTSMASPHVAGATALMHQYLQKTDNKYLKEKVGADKVTLIESLMMCTATPLVDTVTNVPLTPRSEGAGLLNAYAAINTPAYLYNTTSQKAKIELGDKLTSEFEMNFNIKNFSENNLSYKLSGYVIGDEYEKKNFSIDGDNFDKYFLTGKSTKLENAKILYNEQDINEVEVKVDVKAGEDVNVKLTVKLDPEKVKEYEEVFDKGFFVEGFIQLNEEDASNPVLSIPYMGFYGDWKEADIFDRMMVYRETKQEAIDNNYDVFYQGNSGFDSFVYGANTAEVKQPDGTIRKEYIPDSSGALGVSPVSRLRMGSTDFIAFSPDGDGTNEGVGMYVLPTRNAREVKVEILDAKKEIIKEIGTIYNMEKILPAQTVGGGFTGVVYYYVIGRTTLPYWDGTGVNEDKVLEDGQYYYKVSAAIDYNYEPGVYDQVMEIPVKIDTVRPSFTYSYNHYTKQITITAEDDNYLYDIAVYDSTNYSSNIGYAIEIPRANKSVTLSFKDGYSFNPEKMDIVVLDTAYNAAILKNIDTSRSSEGKVEREKLDGKERQYVLEYESNYTTTEYEHEPLFDEENKDKSINMRATYTVDENTFRREGYYFTGWNTKSDGTGETYMPGQIFTVKAENPYVVLYAQWASDPYNNNPGTPVNPNPGTPVNPNPGTPANPNPGQGGGTTIGDEGVPGGQAPTVNLFDDVATNDWYYNDVMSMLQKGIMKGVSENQFAPNKSTNRAMIATILHRLGGEEAVDFQSIFSDVLSEDWFAGSVSWAALQEVVKGYDDGTYKPLKDITREQLAAMIYRYIQAKGLGYKDGETFKLNFVDEQKVSEYAKEAVAWLNANGIINGKDGGNFDPQANATRAEVSAVINRLLNLLEKAN